jgi:hypothetical protein
MTVLGGRCTITVLGCTKVVGCSTEVGCVTTVCTVAAQDIRNKVFVFVVDARGSQARVAGFAPGIHAHRKFHITWLLHYCTRSVHLAADAFVPGQVRDRDQSRNFF